MADWSVGDCHRQGGAVYSNEREGAAAKFGIAIRGVGDFEVAPWNPGGGWLSQIPGFDENRARGVVSHLIGISIGRWH